MGEVLGEFYIASSSSSDRVQTDVALCEEWGQIVDKPFESYVLRCFFDSVTDRADDGKFYIRFTDRSVLGYLYEVSRSISVRWMVAADENTPASSRLPYIVLQYWFLESVYRLTRRGTHRFDRTTRQIYLHLLSWS